MLRAVHATCPSDMDKLIQFVKNLKASGGGDWPEAGKTAFCSVLTHLILRNPDILDGNANKILIHFTDAPPHHATNKHDNYNAEKKELLEQQKRYVSKGMYKQHPGFDWICICDEFSRLGIPVFTITPKKYFRIEKVWPFYAILAHRSGGKVIVLNDTSPDSITRATMAILLQRIGQPFDCSEDIQELKLDEKDQERMENFKESETSDYSMFQEFENLKFETLIHIEETKHLFRDLSDLKSKFKYSGIFNEIVWHAMLELVNEENIMALTYNSVLGSLWRLVCTSCVYSPSRHHLLTGKDNNNNNNRFTA